MNTSRLFLAAYAIGSRADPVQLKNHTLNIHVSRYASHDRAGFALGSHYRAGFALGDRLLELGVARLQVLELEAELDDVVHYLVRRELGEAASVHVVVAAHRRARRLGEEQGPRREFGR